MLELVAKMSKLFAVLRNYFDRSIKLFSDLYLYLYLAKFLDTSAKSFFPCSYDKSARIFITSRTFEFRLRHEQIDKSSTRITVLQL